MASMSPQKYWTQPPLQQSTMSWNYSKINPDNKFLPVHKSRKGMHLNIPQEFYNITKEQSCILNVPVLNSGGCSDMEYVFLRQQVLDRQNQFQQIQMPFGNAPNYPPAVTINIGAPALPLQYGCQQKLSYSTVSINPSTLISEEPWHQKRTIIPTGVYCNCDNRTACTHKVTSIESTEQRVIEPDNSVKSLNEDGFVYVTAPPKISPLRALWKIFTCKRRKRHGEVYLPQVMVKKEQDCSVCPKCSTTSIKNTSLYRNGKSQPYGVLSRLSTITESEVTVSEYSSEEFISPEERERREKEKKQFQPPQRTYTGTGRTMQVGSGSINSAMLSQSFYPQGQVYRWVCEPVKEQKKRFYNTLGHEKYTCYKETVV